MDATVGGGEESPSTSHVLTLPKAYKEEDWLRAMDLQERGGSHG